jgi:hypothetical protein
MCLFTALSFAACSDVLDKAPDGNMQMDEVLSDPDKVEALLNTCYNGIDEKGYRYWFHEPLIVACTDDGWSSEDGAGVPVDWCYKDANSAAGHSFDNYYFWSNNWAQIRLCSQFIEVMDNPDAAMNSENNRGRFKAEARVLRAFFYMETIKWFGQLPVLDATIPYDADFTTLSRQPVYDVAKLIVSDCDAALAESLLPWRITLPQEAGRVTKALALALKSEALMFAASPLHNGGNNYWEEAYQASKDAVTQLKANGYALYTQCTQPEVFGTGPAAAFRQLSTTDADYSASPRDRETIYQVREADGDVWMTGGSKDVWHIGYIGSNMPGTYKCGTCPTQELVDAFETRDGQPILNLSKPYLDEKHLEPNYNTANTLYDPENPYENRDPRFYETVLYNGSHILFQGEGGDASSIVDWEVQTYEGGRHEVSFNSTNRTNSRTGYYQCKVVVPGSCDLNRHNNSRWKYYRLGETLLNLAETAAEAGHSAEALAAVNEVRERSGMPPLPSNLSKDDLILRIHNERRVELAWEENRYFDLRRWQSPAGDLSETCKWLTAMVITKEADGSLIYERRNISQNPRGGWQNRDLLLPVPLTEASLLESITGQQWQNRGW